MPKKQPFTTVKIQCTPLLKMYLENNFGTPVNIPDDHVLKKLATSQLVKQNIRPNGGSVKGETLKGYTEVIELAIHANNFLFDGFNITESNTRRFNEAVNNYIKDLYLSNLDSLLIAQEKQTDWKRRFENLMLEVKNISKPSAKRISELKRELEENELNIKKAIEIVIYDILHVDIDVLATETVRKAYYRYRSNPNALKFYTPTSQSIN